MDSVKNAGSGGSTERKQLPGIKRSELIKELKREVSEEVAKKVAKEMKEIKEVKGLLQRLTESRLLNEYKKGYEEGKKEGMKVERPANVAQKIKIPEFKIPEESMKRLDDAIEEFGKALGKFLKAKGLIKNE